MASAASVQKKALKKARWQALPPYHKFAWITTRISLAIIMLAILGTIRSPNNTSTHTAIPLAVALVPMVVIWLVWMPVLWMYIRRQTNAAFAAAAAATQPIPSPAQIHDALLNEWGREPTIEEISAVHQMLHNQKNMALVQAGMGFGGLYLLVKAGR